LTNIFNNFELAA